MAQSITGALSSEKWRTAIGALSKSARERRAREIVAESGADTEEHFNRVGKQETGVTFNEQAESWIERVKARKRKPVAISTLESWEGSLRKWLNPLRGSRNGCGHTHDSRSKAEAFRSAAQDQQRRFSASGGLDTSQFRGRPLEAGCVPHTEVLKQEVLRQHG
jgi:hypothetical protein